MSLISSQVPDRRCEQWDVMHAEKPRRNQKNGDRVFDLKELRRARMLFTPRRRVKIDDRPSCRARSAKIAIESDVEPIDALKMENTVRHRETRSWWTIWAWSRSKDKI